MYKNTNRSLTLLTTRLNLLRKITLSLSSQRTLASSYGSQGWYKLSGKEKGSRLITNGWKTQEEYSPVVFIIPDLCLPYHVTASSGCSASKPCAAQTLPASFPQEIQFLLGFHS